MQAFLSICYIISSQTCILECDLACTSNAQMMVVKAKQEISNLCFSKFHSLIDLIETLVLH